MFVHAIETAAKFTRPIHSISRNYRSTAIHPGAATLFFVNPDGWSLTCAHVAHQLQVAEQILVKYQAFKNELASRRGEKTETKLLKDLELKYGYSEQITVELYSSFVNCIEGELKFMARRHKTLDVALLKFETNRLLCDTFPVFPRDTSGLKQGKFLCRLGFPFPEFTNFQYDETNNAIMWSETGQRDTPRFPIEGMVTRHVKDKEGNISGFEMSTPGLRGQSGGPAFDVDGKVWGMQAATGHLDIDFDVDQEVVRGGLPKRVQDSAFLHVGLCIHVDALKAFMRENDVQFQEE